MRLVQYAYYRLLKRRSFTLCGKSYPYFYHLCNATFLKERAIEIPVAIALFRQHAGKEILEVGNVMNQYYSVPHDVVDKYEKGDGVINVDVVEYKPNKKYDLIVSISTLEHVGWDETPREKDKFIKALHILRGFLAPGGVLYASIPVGYNDDVDQALRENRVPLSELHFFKRVSPDNRWEEVTYDDVKGSRCDTGYVRANAVLIGFHRAQPTPIR